MVEFHDLMVVKEKLIDPPPDDRGESIINSNSFQRDMLASKFVGNNIQCLQVRAHLNLWNADSARIGW